MLKCNTRQIKQYFMDNKVRYEENDTCLYVRDGAGFEIIFYHEDPKTWKRNANDVVVCFSAEFDEKIDCIDEPMHQNLEYLLFDLVCANLVWREGELV